MGNIGTIYCWGGGGGGKPPGGRRGLVLGLRDTLGMGIIHPGTHWGNEEGSSSVRRGVADVVVHFLRQETVWQ